MSEEASRFAIGSGRERPPYEPKRLECPQCGAGIALRDERAQITVCQHCAAQIELTAGEARAIGALQSAPPPEMLLGIGQPVEFQNTRYEVVGRIAKGEIGEPNEPLTVSYLLYNPSMPSLWLSSYLNEWQISKRTRVLLEKDPLNCPPQRIKAYDGREWNLQEPAEDSEIRYVDGALPWLAKVGDGVRSAELKLATNKGQFYEVERSSSGELEQSEGSYLTPDAVSQMTGVPIAPVADETLAVEKQPSLRGVAVVSVVFGVVCLFTAAFFTWGGSTLLTETLPAHGGQVGPIQIDKASTVIDIALGQRLRQDGWIYVEGEVLDDDEEYLFGFGEELWAESGYDDGPWHEENNDFGLDVTIPEPGSYYIALTTSESEGRGLGASTQPAALAREVGGPIRLEITRRPGSGIPFLLAGIIGVILGLLLFEAATGTVRRVVSNMNKGGD